MGHDTWCVEGEVVFYSGVEYVFYVFWDGFPCVAALVEDGLEEGVLQCGSRWGVFCYQFGEGFDYDGYCSIRG